MALFLGLLPRPVAPSRPLTWLARTDKEATGDPWPADAAGIRTDWLEEPESVLRGLTDRLIDLVRRHPRSSVLRRCLSRIYTPVARARLRRGCSILSRGRVVITDRLHGHILSVLLGIPHVVHDNTYGKLSSFHRTWTSDGELVRWAGSKAEALRIAQEVLEEERTRADGAAHPSAQGGSGT
jgi:pyruvyl transferase EpsO